MTARCVFTISSHNSFSRSASGDVLLLWNSRFHIFLRVLVRECVVLLQFVGRVHHCGSDLKPVHTERTARDADIALCVRWRSLTRAVFHGVRHVLVHVSGSHKTTDNFVLVKLEGGGVRRSMRSPPPLSTFHEVLWRHIVYILRQIAVCLIICKQQNQDLSFAHCSCLLCRCK